MSTYRFIDYDEGDFAITEVDDNGDEGPEIEPFASKDDLYDFVDEHEEDEFEIERDGRIVFDGLSAEDARQEIENL